MNGFSVKKIIGILLIFLTLGNIALADGIDYGNTASWAYWRIGEDKKADLFIVCPTVDLSIDGRTNMDLADETVKGSFTGALNMQRGIYEDSCRMYAPYYRQAVMADYLLPPETAAPFFDLAYSDVRAAFLYYMEHENNGRPFILSGFSQGAEMCLRLLKEFGGEDFVRDNMAACYAIGWRLTRQEISAYPHLKPAQSADDPGTIIMFSSEAPHIKNSLMIPAGVKTIAINPLNWRTDSKPADKALNSGACFVDYNGAIREIPRLTGCYLDEERGALKVTDIDENAYPPLLPTFEKGVYHIYDYQFFFRNLQQNVKLRIEKFLEEREEEAA